MDGISPVQKCLKSWVWLAAKFENCNLIGLGSDKDGLPQLEDEVQSLDEQCVFTLQEG